MPYLMGADSLLTRVVKDKKKKKNVSELISVCFAFYEKKGTLANYIHSEGELINV